MAEGNDFALELVVGIKDVFTQKAKQIDAEVNKLDKDTKALQKTCDDVAAYNKATTALKKMGEASDTSAEDMKQQERVVDDLSKSLKKAGVDINNITREEQRLTRQMKETNTELKKRSGFKDLITGGITAVASHGLLKAFMAAGDQAAKIELLMRNQSNLSEAEIKGDQGRKFRTAMTQKYGVHAGETAGTQTWFNRQNQLDGKKNEAATAASLHLGNLMQGQVGQEEINRAMTQLIAGGTAPDKAASLLYTTFKNGRGDAGDLMDTVNEYFTNLHSRGVSAEQFFATLIQGTTKGGVFSYDKVADSLKETFNARLSDQGMMATLLGEGKKKGVIEEVRDGKLKYALKNALSKYQSDLASGKSTVGDVAEVYKQLGNLAKSDPAAMRDISEQIGGTMLAEDTSKDTAGAISQGLSNPNAILGDHQNDFDNNHQALTQGEQLEANKVASVESLSNASADASKHLLGLSDALTSVTTKLTSLSNDHPMAGEVAAGLFGGALFAGKALGGVRMLRGAGKLLGLGSVGSRFAGLAGEGSLLSRGLSGGAGILAKGARFGGKVLKPLALAGGAYEAWQDHEQGDNRGASHALGSTIGGTLGADIGATVGSIIPGFGTAVGFVAGGWLGDKLGGWIGDKAYDWLGNDDKHDTSQQQMQTMVNNLPSSEDASTTLGGGTMPTIELNYGPQIQIQAMTADPEDISKALSEALRQASPELVQQLEYALAQLMQTNDHQRPSN